MTTTTTIQRPTTLDPHDHRRATHRPARNVVRLSVAAVALSIGAAAVYVASDTTTDGPRSEWTSEDGLRWEHPDGRSYVVATPQKIRDR